LPQVTPNLKSNRVFVTFFCLVFMSLASVSNADLRRYYLNNENFKFDYVEIENFQVKKHPPLMSHPYEVVVPNTERGGLIGCTVFVPTAEGGNVQSRSINNTNVNTRVHRGPTVLHGRENTQYIETRAGTTHLLFSVKAANATFRCFDLVLLSRTGRSE